MNRLDAGCEEPAGRWVLAAFLVAALACLLPLLPVAIALSFLDLPAALVAPIAAAPGGALLAVKSAAILWVLAPRSWSASRGAAAAEHID